MVEQYTPIPNSILTSTIWLESAAVRIVWWTMLMTCTRHGFVMGSIPGLAHAANVTVDECREAIRVLMSEDPDSRSKEENGKRIAEIEGGWRIINHKKHRAMMGLERPTSTPRVQKHRAARNDETHNETDVTHETLRNGETPGNAHININLNREEDPPLPPKQSATPRPKDPMGDSLESRAHWQRADVASVFEVWKTSVGITAARRDHYANPNTQPIAEAIDAYGLEDCLLVAKHCMRDGMVNGEADEHKNTHKTAKYVFGNLDAFQRILTMARKQVDATKKSVREQMAERLAQ